jgi:hypothetical protein
MCKAKCSRRFIATDIQNLAVINLPSLMPMKAANVLVLHNSDQNTFQLPYFQKKRLLMLCGRSDYDIAYQKSHVINIYIHSDLNLLVAIQAN